MIDIFATWLPEFFAIHYGFLAGIFTKQFWNIPEEKYFAQLRRLNLFIKFFVNPFADIAFIYLFIYLFIESLFNLFLFKSVLLRD